MYCLMYCTAQVCAGFYRVKCPATQAKCARNHKNYEIQKPYVPQFRLLLVRINTDLHQTWDQVCVSGITLEAFN